MKGFFAFGLVLLLLLAPVLTAQAIASCSTAITENAVLANDVNYAGSGSCLSFGASNVTLDCEGKKITGTGAYPQIGVFASAVKNITVKNCVIDGFYQGISLNFTNDSIVFANVVENNYFGIQVSSSNGNNISSNTINESLVGVNVSVGVDSNYVGSANNYLGSNTIVNSSDLGLFIDPISGSTRVYSNYVCSDLAYDDIVSYSFTSGRSNSGDFNTCDVSSGYNDTGVTGCTSTCGVVPMPTPTPTPTATPSPSPTPTPTPDVSLLYVGGWFTDVAGVVVESVAGITASGQVQPVGSGLGGVVNSLVVFDGELYAGGQFYSSGGVALNGVARFDSVSSSWQPVGSGFNGQVLSLVVFNGELYAGGEFSASGGVALNGVARFDSVSSSWQPVGSGVS
ncbi:hypothetical protein HY993_03310, partial [Candidatus Micrarchaeota archaeon]|nr:hypothetical protein [Candidatus Micrarchaeota archaeon]